MSLTTLLRTDPVFRQYMAAAIIKPPRKGVKPVLQVPARTTRFNVTGTAFDYLLRFDLERRFPQHRGGGVWVAEHGAAGVTRQVRKVRAFLAAARQLHATYLSGAGSLEETALACTVLAKLDLIYRAGWEDPELLTPLPEMALELQELLEVVPFEQFQVRHTLWTNPSFGVASFAVGGADADLIVDDCLIDIKTTSKAAVSLDELRQLAGYYLLWQMLIPA